MTAKKQNKNVNILNIKKLLLMFQKKQKVFIRLSFLVIILGLLYFNLGLFVAATVNGVPITRFTVIKQLEKEGGSQVLESLITQKLIAQRASESKILISDEEVNSQIEKISKQLEEQGLDLETALSYQGQTKEDLAKNIKLQLILEKLLKDKIEVSEEEARNYFETNESVYEDQVYEDVSDEIKDTLKQQKLSQEYQTFLQETKTNSSIKKFVDF